MGRKTQWFYVVFPLLVALSVSGCLSELERDGETSDTPAVVLINAVVIDGVSDEPLRDRTVIVRGSRIVAVEVGGALELPGNANVFDLQGATLLPGLINAHVHLTPNQNRDAALETMLRMGVTTVRDLGGNGQLLATLAVPSATRPMVVFAGTMFGQGFMDDPRVRRASLPFAPGEAPWMKLVNSQTNIPEAVAAARSAGVSGLKLYASLDANTVERISNEAHKQGLLVWSHSVIFPAGPEDSVLAGVDELIHSKGLVALGADDVPDTFAEGIPGWMSQRSFANLDPRSDMYHLLFEDMRRQGVALNPALIADGDVSMRTKPLPPKMAAMRDWACAATGAAFDAGVTIVAGTDYFGEPGLLFLEIERLTDCGLTPVEAIRAATANSASALGLAATQGTIEAGKVADLVVVRGDPASKISDMRNTVLVIKGGQVVFNGLVPL